LYFSVNLILGYALEISGGKENLGVTLSSLSTSSSSECSDSLVLPSEGKENHFVVIKESEEVKKVEFKNKYQKRIKVKCREPHHHYRGEAKKEFGMYCFIIIYYFLTVFSLPIEMCSSLGTIPSESNIEKVF
jgi:hypothetical protein